MEKEFDYKGQTYWVKLDNAIHPVTQEACLNAYINDEKPGGLLFGELVKDEEGKPMFFGDQLAAYTNANAVKQSMIDSKQI